MNKMLVRFIVKRSESKFPYDLKTTGSFRVGNRRISNISLVIIDHPKTSFSTQK